MEKAITPSQIDFEEIKCVVFDYGLTLSSDFYFKVVPPEYPNWQSIIEESIFSEPEIVNQWMQAKLTITDIAGIISRYVDLELKHIVSIMEEGCKNLHFNQAVWDFAQAQRRQGRKTALVTANMDVFSTVVVPAHNLDQMFDVIINSFDYQELNKEILWPIAFKKLGEGIGYSNSLLIEDGIKNIEKFRERGGIAVQYDNNDLFNQWLDFMGWVN